MALHLDWNDISYWINRSKQLFIKKLARNDTAWADSTQNGHQNGFFIPRTIAESGFFPELKNSNPRKAHIFDAEYETFWPASDTSRVSVIKYFSKRNPGNPEKERPRYEWHHTGMCKTHFQSLSPASLLLVGKLEQPVSNAFYWFVTIDSLREEAGIIETVFDLDSDFHYGLFDLSESAIPDIETECLIAELDQAIRSGDLDKFVRQAAVPSPQELARQAQDQWLRENGIEDMNPFAIAKPGDAVMRISRDIEYRLYKRAELRFRASQIARVLMRNGSPTLDNVVRGFSELDKIFLSAAQTRKSRAGLSFEHHVERMLRDGHIAHTPQAVFGGRRPDFVLPDIETPNSFPETIILSLKTTLRERWKQLALEKTFGAVFLATVDDRISGEAIDEMKRHNIVLVVPESLKNSSESTYSINENIMTFKEFFDEEIRRKRPSLILSGS